MDSLDSLATMDNNISYLFEDMENTAIISGVSRFKIQS